MTESPSTCPYCGAPLAPDAHTCSFCGQPTISATKDAAAEAATAATESPDSAYVNTFPPSTDVVEFPNAPAFTNAPTFAPAPARKKGSILLPVVIGGIALVLVCICLASAALLLFNYSPGGRAPIDLPVPMATSVPAKPRPDFSGVRFSDGASLTSPVTAVQKLTQPADR